MPRPLHGDLHVNKLLTNLSMAYFQSENAFISGKVFPLVNVDKQSDLYPVYDKKWWFMNKAQKRAPSTESIGIEYTVSEESYYCHKWAVHKDVPDEERANQDSPFDGDRDSTRLVTRMLLMSREINWATNYFTTGVWGTDLEGVNAGPGAGQFLQWDDADSVPIMDIKQAAREMERVTGIRPNTLVLGSEVYDILGEHPSFLDKIKYTQKGIVTKDLMAACMDLQNIYVPSAVQNTANPADTEVMSFIHDKSALLLYVPKAPSLFTPSAGLTFAWKGLLGSAAYGGRIKNFRMEELEADRIEGEHAIDQKLIADDLGTFFEKCTP